MFDNAYVKKRLLKYSERLRKEPVFSKILELEKNQFSSPEEINRKQLIKIKNLLSFAYSNSVFYKNVFKQYGLTPDDINTIKDFEAFPVLTKDIIKENIESIICKRVKNFPVKTSGSTGRPLNFFKDRIASAYSYAAMYRGHRWHGVDICDKEAYLWGIPLNKNEFYTAKIKDFILNRFREKKFNLTDDVNYHFYNKMIKTKPKILSGYATLIYEFAQFVKSKNLNMEPIKLKMVKYTAEMMHDFQKEVIKSVFSCPVISEYGSAETGIVAFECSKGSNHLLTDCVHHEFKKDEDSGFYKIIITNLNSYGFPIIKYDTGDLVKSDKLSACSCDLPFPVMDTIIGRRNDIIITPEGKRIHSNIFSYIIKDLLKKHKMLNQVRFIQTEVKELKVLISLSDNTKYEKVCAEIKKHTRERISRTINLVFEYQEKLDRDESGKLRYFYSMIN